MQFMAPVTVVCETCQGHRFQPEVLAVREQLGNPRHVLLGVDRLDYTKGIPDRLEGFAQAGARNHAILDDEVRADPANHQRIDHPHGHPAQFGENHREREREHRPELVAQVVK